MILSIIKQRNDKNINKNNRNINKIKQISNGDNEVKQSDKIKTKPKKTNKLQKIHDKKLLLININEEKEINDLNNDFNKSISKTNVYYSDLLDDPMVERLGDDFKKWLKEKIKLKKNIL